MDYDTIARLCERQSEMSRAPIIDADELHDSLNQICDAAETVWNRPAVSFADILARAQIAHSLTDQDASSPSERAAAELIRAVLDVARREGFTR